MLAFPTDQPLPPVVSLWLGGRLDTLDAVGWAAEDPDPLVRAWGAQLGRAYTARMISTATL